MMHRLRSSSRFCACLLVLAACDSANDDYESEATLDVKQYVNAQLEKLSKAAEAIEKAAPAADDDGWNAKDDAEALKNMRKAWGDAREAYERVEGSIAVLFKGLDRYTDERYDGFIEEEKDDDLFDDEGVVGVHAIERILWSDSIPEHVMKFESTLPGYKPAAFPANKEEADAFKNKLCKRLTRETKIMRDQFATVALQPGAAFWGMIGSMEEQAEKTTKAASGEDESRYAQNTLADMRANLAGARAVFDAFKPWIEAKSGNAAIEEIETEFKEVADAYAEIDGVALPQVPAKFNPDKPTDTDLKTPYGKLWQLLNEKTDPEDDTSLVHKMMNTADDMGIEPQ